MTPRAIISLKSVTFSTLAELPDSWTTTLITFSTSFYIWHSRGREPLINIADLIRLEIFACEEG